MPMDKNEQLPDSDTRSRDLDVMLKRAMGEPGIKELMAVYEQWKRVEVVARAGREAIRIRKVISVSNTSLPTF